MLAAQVIRPSTSPWASPIVPKCRFGGNRVLYLGHLIGSGELKPDPRKVQAVRDYPQPKTKKDVRAFLGLVVYYCRFIPQFASVAAPLSDLTRKGQPQLINWTEIQETAFKALKHSLMETPLLLVADPGKPYTLQTDASDRGLGAVLSQASDNWEKLPVAYASRKLLPQELNYSTIEEECLAVVWALKFFHVYLYGQPFLIQTDHQPLAWLQRMKNANARPTRWALFVQPYHFTIAHRKGADNGNADGLSRGTLSMDRDDSLDS